MINTKLLNECLDLENKAMNGLLISPQVATNLLKKIQVEVNRLITLQDEKIVPESFVTDDLKELSKYIFLCKKFGGV